MLNTTLYDRYYLQNCKAITFRKITNHAKYKKPNVPGHLYIFWLILMKQIIAPPLSAVERNRFSKNSAWNFEWGAETWRKMRRFNAFSRNVNTINLKVFPTRGGRDKLEKIQQAFWRQIKP